MPDTSPTPARGPLRDGDSILMSLLLMQAARRRQMMLSGFGQVIPASMPMQQPMPPQAGLFGGMYGR